VRVGERRPALAAEGADDFRRRAVSSRRAGHDREAGRWKRDPGDERCAGCLPAGAAVTERPVRRIAGGVVSDGAAEASAVGVCWWHGWVLPRRSAWVDTAAHSLLPVLAADAVRRRRPRCPDVRRAATDVAAGDGMATSWTHRSGRDSGPGRIRPTTADISPRSRRRPAGASIARCDGGVPQARTPAVARPAGRAISAAGE